MEKTFPYKTPIDSLQHVTSHVMGSNEYFSVEQREVVHIKNILCIGKTLCDHVPIFLLWHVSQ